MNDKPVSPRQLSLCVGNLTEPAKARLLSCPHAIQNMKDFAYAARNGDDEPMSMSFEGGELFLQWSKDHVDITIDFQNDDAIFAELDGCDFTVFGFRIPSAVASSSCGKTLASLVDLPSHMNDISQATIEKIEESGIATIFTLDLDRVSFTSEDVQKVPDGKS